jgi:membrane protein YqaA with SNARE-associated domain
MRIWGFWRKEVTDPACESSTVSTTGSNDVVTPSQFLSDVQESIPKVNRANATRLIVGVVVFLAFLALFSLLIAALARLGDIKDTGYAGVFVANFVSSMGVVFPLPISPGATVTIAVAAAGSPLAAGLLAGVAATLGEFTAYWLGYGGERFIHFRDHRQYKMADRWMGRYGGLTITFFAFVPFFMFDFVGIAAGALRYPFKKFLIFCFLGRLPRCLIEAYVGSQLVEIVMPHLPHWIHAPFID